jgi:hypothetical protein
VSCVLQRVLLSEGCDGELRIAARLAVCTCVYGTWPSLTCYTTVPVLAQVMKAWGEVKVQLHTF